MLESRVVGNYDVQILAADNATALADSVKALDEWLTGNGFAGLTQAGRRIAADYIKNKWFFVAARLHRAAPVGGDLIPWP